ncbi:MAG TPA: hypothetical protein PK971_15770, partial [Saprospiraceae bacterium]|nr:hypothetical protein [Saprospiraceae bacterium]
MISAADDQFQFGAVIQIVHRTLSLPCQRRREKSRYSSLHALFHKIQFCNNEAISTKTGFP